MDVADVAAEREENMSSSGVEDVTEEQEDGIGLGEMISEGMTTDERGEDRGV